MIFKVVIVISTIISTIECKKSFIIRGQGWKNEVTKCWNGGGDNHPYNFNIGSLQSIGLKYEDVDDNIIVIKAYGHLELHTRSSGSIQETLMHLSEYNGKNGYKQYAKTWTIERSLLWATQKASITLNVKIYEEGTISLHNNVYAYSSWSVSCAWTKAFVDSIEIISFKEIEENEDECNDDDCKYQCWLKHRDTSPQDFEGCISGTQNKSRQKMCSCKIEKEVNGVSHLSGFLSHWSFKIIHFVVILLLPKSLVCF